MKTYCLTNPPKKHPDIGILQSALKKDRFYKGAIDNIFGRSTGLACKDAKWHFGYPKSQCNECGGQILLEYLTGKRRLPLAYRIRRKARGFGLTQEDKIRRALVEYAEWGFTNERNIHYAQTRPMENLHNVKRLPWTTDCSENVTTYYCWAGAPDPNGLKYNGQGYTGTLLDNGKTVALHDAKAGDLVIFGSHPGHHVVMLVEDGDNGDPYISSHGQESGPKKLRLSQEAAAQPQPVTIKSYL